MYSKFSVCIFYLHSLACTEKVIKHNLLDHVLNATIQHVWQFYETKKKTLSRKQENSIVYYYELISEYVKFSRNMSRNIRDHLNLLWDNVKDIQFRMLAELLVSRAI